MNDFICQDNHYQMLGYLADRGQIVNRIEVCSALWDELLEAPFEKDWIRCLRIDLRKLRSALVVLEPLLPLEGRLWLEALKVRFNKLGSVREYDVALQACAKYKEFVALLDETQQENWLKELPMIEKMLEQQRELKTALWSSESCLGEISQEMKLLRELLEEPIELSIENEAKANAFLQTRLQLWGLKLCNKLKNLDKMTSSEQLHKLRIKVKRFRYVYEVYMGDAGEQELILRLKELQDILGSMHDSDTNLKLVSGLSAEINNQALLQEIACFRAWREIKKEQRVQQLEPAVKALLAVLEQNVVAAELL